MIVTKNGTIDGIPYTSMLKKDGVWRYLLVCRVSLDKTGDELTALFATDTVEDDAIGVTWHYTDLVKVTADEAYKYVWLTYTERTAVSEQYEEALNVLGVQTEEVTEETEVTTDETN